MEYVNAKTIITSVKGGDNWFSMDYNMNIYRGCCHGCIYCDSRSDCYHIECFDKVKAKDKTLEIIREELRRKFKKGTIGTGAMSDPYNPFEEKLELTKDALNMVDLFKFGIAIATKSPLVTRDIDILKKIKEHSPVIVKMTVTTADDELCKKIEPNVAPTSKRLQAIKKLSDSGIYSGILMMPILPFINDTKENVLKIINLAKQNGAKFIFPGFGVTLRNNQREHYFQKLDEIFPDLSEKYKSQYGNRYNCTIPKSQELYKVFSEECKKLGIIYKMPDIIKAYKSGYNAEQMSFFY